MKSTIRMPGTVVKSAHVLGFRSFKSLDTRYKLFSHILRYLPCLNYSDCTLRCRTGKIDTPLKSSLCIDVSLAISRFS